MAKRRKTREQKKLSDLRHTFTHQIVTNTFETRPSSTQISPKVIAVATSNYPYLVKDLSKTFILTASIIGLQILLFISLKTHLIKIPGISY
ncbi:MAG: hypothetical protein HY344_02500 [Candidatus Levybacteria bacterium]|nr:hypothetical protein [Candidatus Levybacteria bacterium]